MPAPFKPVDFEPSGRRRSRRAVPGWLVLLLGGMAIGAGAVVLVQERFLPPRLSADAAAELRASFEQADSDRLRLKRELADTAKRLEAALADKKGLANELAVSRKTAESLREDVASLVASLPPDPRGGVIEVRAARFAVKAGTLAYDVVLARERTSGKALTGVMQLVVAGESGRGSANTITLEPVPISVGQHENVRGSVSLPEGFQPRQTTIRVLDRAGGKLLGMRVMLVK